LTNWNRTKTFRRYFTTYNNYITPQQRGYYFKYMQTNPTHPVVLFDGVCNFCNGAVNFTIRQDKNKVIRFAPLQSAAGQQLLQQYGLPQQDFKSFYFIEAGTAYSSSTAALRVCRYYPWYWQWVQVFWIIPAFIRNAVYNLIARNRYKLFGQKDTCMVPTPDISQRFLG
jgi:predicted DCC family thiol-disulfide oxidoreductase YuxK